MGYRVVEVNRHDRRSRRTSGAPAAGSNCKSTNAGYRALVEFLRVVDSGGTDRISGNASISSAGEKDERWLIFAGPGGERFGRVVREEEEYFAVELPGGASEEVPRSRRSQRVVTSDSFDLRNLRSPGSLRGEYQREPTEFIVRLLAQAPLGRSKDELLRRLSDYGIEVDPPTWKRLHAALRKHPNVAVESTSPSKYLWRESAPKSARPDGVDIDKLLEQAFSTRTSADARREAVAELTGRVESLDAGRAVLARAAGCPVTAPKWEDVRLDGLDERLAGRLLDEAAVARAWPFLIGVALDISRRGRSEQATELLSAAPRERNRHLEGAIDDLTRRFDSASELNSAIESLGRRLSVLSRLAAGGTDEPVIAAFLRLAKAVGAKVERSSAAQALHVRILVATADAAASDSVLASAIRGHRFGPTDLDRLRSSLACLPLSGATRSRWLRALAAGVKSVELGNPQWWEGASLDDLALIDQDDRLGPIVRTHPEILKAPVARAIAARPPGLGTIFNLPPVLLARVDPVAIAAALERLDESHPLRALAERSVAAALSDERVAAQRQMDEVVADHRSEMAQLEAQLASERQETIAERAHATDLARRLRETLAAGEEDRGAQTRQARLDALIVIADMAAELERSLAALTSGTLRTDEVISAILRKAATVGVTRDAPIGATVALDRTRYELINDDGRTSGPVIVVEPSFLGVDRDAVISLRSGKAAVQKDEHDGEGTAEDGKAHQPGSRD